MTKALLGDLIEVTEQHLKIEELKVKTKLEEAKEQREHWWIYIIWSIGGILIFILLMIQRG